MIKFKGFNNNDIYIAKNKIIGLQKQTPTTTTLFIGCDIGSEEWIILEPLEDVLTKYFESHE